MKFKVDENLPIEIAELLRSAGHEAHTVREEGMAGADDPILGSVLQRERRVLVTVDKDFSDIRAYPPSEYPGIIVLRARRQSKWLLLALARMVVPLLPAEPLEGTLWLVQPNRLRIVETSKD